ncbi:PREDICTED: uncharacterized protein LOC106793471 isoform X1 [Polistes canadensis]|uniref:uncharacterized protein LOC106793471 isoform X1 n=1 Tax=Polistes canadensis TaxID=91411 RepID=UPI000718EE84|nr:PREDICTED: uncharacterized protein LOC106793471 isoform X1 [Polistes canadensis]XP_014615926.1 PREDICTED: uncharacterized protein LOC106793471 isoform X1 [Polistes canadensis]
MELSLSGTSTRTKLIKAKGVEENRASVFSRSSIGRECAKTTGIYTHPNSEEKSTSQSKRSLKEEQYNQKIIQELLQQSANTSRIHYSVTNCVNSELTKKKSTLQNTKRSEEVHHQKIIEEIIQRSANTSGISCGVTNRVNSELTEDKSTSSSKRNLEEKQHYRKIIQELIQQSANTSSIHYGLTNCVNSELTNDGPDISQVAPNWAYYSFFPWVYEQALVARSDVQDKCNLSCKKENKLDDVTEQHIKGFKDLPKSKSKSIVLDSEKSNVSKAADLKISNSFVDTIQGHGGNQGTPWKGEKKKEKDNLVNVKKKIDLDFNFWQDQYRSLSETQKLAWNANINYLNYLSNYSQATVNTKLCSTSVNETASYQSSNNFSSNSVKEVNKPLDLSVNATSSVYNRDKDAKIKERYPYLELPAAGDKRTVQSNYPVITQTDFSYNANDSYAAKYKGLNDDLLKILNYNNLSCNVKYDTTQLNVVQENISTDTELNSKSTLNINLKEESKLFLDKYSKGRTYKLSHEKRGRATNLNDRHNNIKEEYSTEELLDKPESIDPAIVASKIILGNWEGSAMSGQYPGHSRPPVGTPPPQTVWNHLTMTQGQGNTFYGLNIHASGLPPGTALNPAGFYTHPSISRASHLTPQLTPQLAHTQAPPTWHTPTVPSKTVTPSNTPGNPLFSLQMLVDNRQNQNQYRNSPGSQNTLDLSATSDIIPENYSRIPQDIPISLTARNVDKGSRNGNIISPPIPLNGETSSDSGISSSVPTPNSVSEPVSLSTKEITTPKITVKNFESNLKGVANIHDKIKEINVVDSFAQKVINLPPSVTIERVVADKKEPETKSKDTLSVIAQVPRNVLPVIVNLTSKIEKDVTDSPKRESSSERDKKHEETSVRSPKNLPKRGKKGVDSLLEKLEGGNKKLGGTENIGSVIVTPVEEKDTSSVKSMSPERPKSKSPTREDEVVSPAFSNDDSNDNTKQRRKRKLEKPVRLSKDSKTEVEDMELEPTEPTEPRTRELISEEVVANCTPATTVKVEERVESVDQRLDDKINENVNENENENDHGNDNENDNENDIENDHEIDNNIEERNEENQPVRRRRSSESSTTNSTSANQRVRRKSSDDATEFSKVTSPKAVNNTNPFNEVESELEKMFAGIDEPKPAVKKEETKVDFTVSGIQNENITKVENIENNILQTKDTQNLEPTDVSSTVDTKLSGKKGKKGKVQGGKRKFSRSTENIFGNIASESPQKDAKKKRVSKSLKKQDFSKKVKKNTKNEGYREMAYDSGSNASSIKSRGPVVHVEGPRDSPLSIQVVNAPREEEEEKNKEKRKTIGNGNAGRSKRLSHQNDLDYRGKVSRAGLFSSTLSSRYDAHTTDSTWVCVFCKQGPHSVIPGDPSRPHPNLAGPHIAPGTYTVPAGVLSDLFGPYLIGKERLEDGILSADEQEITTEQKKGGKNKRSLRYAGLADQFSAKMSKKKRNSVESNTNAMFTGMTVIPGEEQRWEVWLHEQCAVWAAGVYLAGGRVTGLQEAVWDAAKSVCDSCGLTGANIGCVIRGCKSVIHYPCALTKGWHLDMNQYIPKCNLHRVT